jgi:prevent-host-death family protein
VKQIEASKAGDAFCALLDLVEHGEEVIITREGAEIARLVPPSRNQPAESPINREEARAAMRRIRERARKVKLGITLEELLAWRDEGRR